jgi:putative tricarboxylic transport membrane protein
VRLGQLDTRRAEIAVGLIFVAIAAVVIRETFRLGAGWGPSGPQPGFFPTLSALVMAVGALALIVRAARAPGTALFDSRDQAISVLKVGVPIAAAVLAIGYLGFYLVTALYMGLFSAWYGRYRWYVAVAAGLLLPIALFFAFERGFRISLPKSVWYGSVLPF